jgi:sulfoxide reductase catalytic subunit YedY
MKTRRQFVKFSIKLIAGFGAVFSTMGSWLARAYAGTQRILLPKGTELSTLKNKNPATLDTRNLKVRPLKDFETMGLSDHEVDLKSWRLIVEGNVDAAMKLTYFRILELPSIERKVLLICPGFFANHGRWKGVSLVTVLNLARMKAGTTHIIVSGPPGPYEKTEQFPIADIHTDKVFLAYEVNGEKLPRKHGFPLRVVAEDYYGDDWVKYVYKIKPIKAEK